MTFLVRRFVFLGFALLAACAPRLQSSGALIGPATIAGPAVVAEDGYRLPMSVYRAEGSERAVLIAVHGFNDYRHAWSRPAEWWAKAGITTYAYDQRGFGETRERGVWPGVDLMTRDLIAVTRLVRAGHPGVPLYLVGESMGGAVIMAAMRRADAPDVAGVVLAAPAVWGRKAMNPFLRASLWLAAHLLPANKATGRGLGIRASDNTDMLRGLARDPLVIKHTRIDAVYGLVDLMDAAFDAAAQVRVPKLVLYGRNDQVIRRGPVEAMLSHLAAPYRLVVYPKGWHMLFRDLQAEVVWRDVAHWVLDPDSELPSGFERDGPALVAGN